MLHFFMAPMGELKRSACNHIKKPHFVCLIMMKHQNIAAFHKVTLNMGALLHWQPIDVTHSQ